MRVPVLFRTSDSYHFACSGSIKDVLAIARSEKREEMEKSARKCPHIERAREAIRPLFMGYRDTERLASLAGSLREMQWASWPYALASLNEGF